MLVFKTRSELQAYLQARREQGAKIGFTPTMGALHQGHLSLIQLSKRENDCSVCSIFVNPTQFNDPKDLEKYPRTPGKDLVLLDSVGTDVVFIPPVEEIYPPGLDASLPLDLGPLDQVLEAEFRPGHFKGVAQVVKRLLDLVGPDNLYMGQKDFQQITIVGAMIRQLNLPVRLVRGETLREADGLAMSSRNVRLSAENRAKAPIIFQTLQWVKSKLGSVPVSELENEALQRLSIPEFRPEYFRIVRTDNLQSGQPGDGLVACVACWAGDVRLIDNLILE
jgi:pantoate--beta-alanine ligase